jgi:hypothetical protein
VQGAIFTIGTCQDSLICNNLSMSEPTTRVQNGDDLAGKLLALGNSLRPVDVENAYFCQIVTELLDATLTNYRQLRQAYVDNNYPLLAWACRNLLELTIFLKYVLISEANARRFGDDRLIDGVEIFTALKELELYYDPAATTVPLDNAIAQMRAQMAAENVTESGHLAVGRLADQVGMEQEFRTMNRVSSKLVHPTAWSILAVNSEANSFPEAREIMLLSGVGYMAQMLIAAREHNNTHGMRPNP